MPRPAINDYIFYKIVNVNGDVDLCYVGSTANWKLRRHHHKSSCNCETDRGHHYKVYETIRENGGWDEFKMVEIGRAEQLTLTQAHQKEEEYRVELKANMNGRKCFGDKKEYNKQYRIDNPERAKQYYIDNAKRAKQYRIDNADKIKEQTSFRTYCECGGSYTYQHKSKHLKTKKHQAYINHTPDK